MESYVDSLRAMSIGGVPTQVFESKILKPTPFLTINGNTLWVERRRNLICINEINDPSGCEVSAKVKAEIRVDGFIHIVVRTKIDNCGTKHPDLFASRILHAELEYLRKMGTAYRGILAEWSNNPAYSDNYKEFLRGLSDYGIPVSILDDPREIGYNFETLATIAKNTWTGRFAATEKLSEVWKLYRTMTWACFV